MKLSNRIGLDLPPLERGRLEDPGLFGPGSEVWTVGRERVLLLGGPAALLLQLAHPLVAAGVADHSGFRADPFDRLRATLDATLRISFGDSEQARQAAERVRATHRAVRGSLESPTGLFPAATPYSASEPELAMWVHATLVSVALDSFELLVAPLSLERRERYYGEAARFARLFGVTYDVLPPTYEDFRIYFRTMLKGEALTVGDQARSLAAHVLDPPVPPVLRVTRRGVRALTAALLPDRLREAFGLTWGRAERLHSVLLTGAVRGTLRAWPPRIRYWQHYRRALVRVQPTGPGK
jgi:uncharacterized protein (DUF2236 family)